MKKVFKLFLIVSILLVIAGSADPLQYNGTNRWETCAEGCKNRRNIHMHG